MLPPSDKVSGGVAWSQWAHGTPRQRLACRVAGELELLDRLAPYEPRVVGTIPLEVDVDHSDLDLVCHVGDLERFEADLRQAFGLRKGFTTWRRDIAGRSSQVAKFEHAGLPIEIFGQDVPVERQLAVLHLRAEQRLLDEAGAVAREAIRELKRSGLKTEPAFGRYFGLPGDAYEVLAELAHADDTVIRRIARGSTAG